MKIPKILISTKPHYVKIAEDLDFFELFKKIQNDQDTCFILESLGEESNRSRYSIIGFDPQMIVSSQGLCITLSQQGKEDIEYESDNPYFDLRKLLPCQVMTRDYAGGLVGYLGFDVFENIEPTVKVKSHSDFDRLKFGVYIDGLVHDKITGEIFYFYYNKNRLDLVKSYLTKQNSEVSTVSVTFKRYSMTKQQYSDIFDKVKDDIRAGLIFQCVIGFQGEYFIEGNDICIYEKLRRVNPSPHMYYVKFGKQKIIGASPELLFRLRNTIVETFPLAGTIRRGKSLNEDVQLAQILLNDPKEQAEHKMLVDLHRNDLGRIAKLGSVQIQKLMDIKKYSHVQHISSEISGTLDTSQDMFSALASCYPAGTLAGAPKIEAVKLLEKYETEPRGVYGGAVGHFGFNGDCTFAIPIRTLFISGNKGYTQAGSGIVLDSEAHEEYEEIRSKLRAMEIALGLTMSS
ncbi:MAG: anthranilate synthase component I family protein [Candidatus Roizmanbacteria bacterium]|nr:anthranilate synthase component I family protein [Candidatus Roizmanbacteria bacterium]